MQPTQYYRLNKTWSKYLGQKGKVVATTYIRVAGTDFKKLAPYSLVLVDLKKERKMFMGVGHQRLEVGDRVECVLRLVPPNSSQEILEYRVKVKKI